MMDDDGRFGESVAATYDESSAVGPEHWGLPVLHDTVRADVTWAD
ncbi:MULTISPECIES: hypothetical protein [Streptomyces]|nr:MULTISPECIES: hypothetical protein [Streptomyces]MDI5908114.1 hypothetical protein [Streptomyces sp. 12257]